MQARDIMTAAVVTVSPDTPVTEIARTLLDKGISAVPVCGPDGSIVGVVSEADLMHRAELGSERKPRRWWIDLIASREDELARAYVRSHGLRARDVMREGVVSVGPATEVLDLVATMEKAGLRRVFVTEGGSLLGVVTRSNVLRAFLAGREAAHRGESDRVIRAAVLAELHGQPWATIARNGVLVADGIVSFWGHVSSDAERQALRVAAESVPGVRRVEDHTELPPAAVPYWD